jgi:nucleoside-diphosphate-sugar epimerase
LTGEHYPIEKIESLLGQLPYTMKEGVNQTLEWMRKEKLIKMDSKS